MDFPLLEQETSRKSVKVQLTLFNIYRNSHMYSLRQNGWNTLFRRDFPPPFYLSFSLFPYSLGICFQGYKEKMAVYKILQWSFVN